MYIVSPGATTTNILKYVVENSIVKLNTTLKKNSMMYNKEIRWGKKAKINEAWSNKVAYLNQTG